MKSKQTILVLGALIALSSLTYAGGREKASSGTRGGGDMVDISGRPRLRDLVDKTVCRWKNTRSFMESLDETEKVISALRKANWYLADATMREAGRLRLCLTSKLKKVHTEDKNVVTIMKFKKRQLAIRLNNMIFLDYKLFSSLPRQDQAMTMHHEVSHSFLPLGIEGRNGKLRSYVRAVSDLSLGASTAEDLEIALETNEISLPWNTSDLDPYQNDIETLLNPNLDEKLKHQAFNRIPYDEVRDDLFWFDRDVIANTIAPKYADLARAVCWNDRRTLKEAMKFAQSTQAIISDQELDTLASLIRAQSCESGQFETSIRFGLGHETGEHSLLEVTLRGESYDLVAELLQNSSPVSLSREALTLIFQAVLNNKLNAETLSLIDFTDINPNMPQVVEAATYVANLDLIKSLLSNPRVTDRTINAALRVALTIEDGDKNLKKAKARAKIITWIVDRGLIEKTHKIEDTPIAEFAWSSQNPIALREFLRLSFPFEHFTEDGSTRLIQSMGIPGQKGALLVEALLSDPNAPVSFRHPKKGTALDAAEDADNSRTGAILFADARQKVPVSKMKSPFTSVYYNQFILDLAFQNNDLVKGRKILETVSFEGRFLEVLILQGEEKNQEEFVTLLESFLPKKKAQKKKRRRLKRRKNRRRK